MNSHSFRTLPKPREGIPGTGQHTGGKGGKTKGGKSKSGKGRAEPWYPCRVCKEKTGAEAYHWPEFAPLFRRTASFS